MKTTLILAVLIVALNPAFAKDKPKGHKAPKPVVHAASIAAKPKAAPPERPWVGLDVTIAPFERDVIRAYVRHVIDKSKGRTPNGLPAGLAKETAYGWGKALPEGWRKHCVPGAVLPGAVHKHCQALPHEILVKLPPPPAGTLLLAVDGTVFRVGYPTYEILDVFHVH